MDAFFDGTGIVIFTLLGCFLFFAIIQVYSQARAGWRNAKLARLIRKTGSFHIAQVTAGYAALKGRTVASEPLLTAPM